MPQKTWDHPCNQFHIGFIACLVMVVFVLLLRDPGDYPPRYRRYRRGSRVYWRDYPERRRPGGVLILMLFVAFLIAIIALLTS